MISKKKTNPFHTPPHPPPPPSSLPQPPSPSSPRPPSPPSSPSSPPPSSPTPSFEGLLPPTLPHLFLALARTTSCNLATFALVSSSVRDLGVPDELLLRVR